MKKLIKRVLHKLARKKFVRGYDKFCREPIGRALVYYKTEPLALKSAREDQSHTNNWEAYEMARVLNRLGLVVDVIDRTADLEDVNKYVEDIYDIFIGLGAGDSGQYFPDIAERVPSAAKVLYAMGPEPDLSDQVTRERHNYFRRRHPEIPVIDRRLVSAVDTSRLYKATDAIITIGNEFSFGSYEQFGKDLHKIYFSSYPELGLPLADLPKRDQKKFFYFGGNGHITKGLDLVLEAFQKLPDYELYIGGPTGEDDFNAFMNPILEKHPNIHMLGFVDVKGELFRDVSSKCGYVILPSCSEGCATSVTTCMRRGLVPVVTVEAGIELGDWGYQIPDIDPEKMADFIREISSTPREEFLRRVVATYEGSFMYTQANYSRTLEMAVRRILAKHGVTKLN